MRETDDICGLEPDEPEDDTCPDCDGQGEVTTMGGPTDWEPPVIKCRECGGTGRID
jgi:DnaJ-class molecular chaperone